MERKKKNSKLGFVAGFLYGGRTCLVTLPRKEEAPARGEEDHGVAVASSTMERVRMNSSSIFWTKGYGGLVWAVLGSC
jgi:hypothetical protein